MPHMYILECADGSYYVGSSWDAEARLWEHNAGLVDGYTTHRRPVRLVYAAWFERIDEAYAAEKQVQGWGRRKRELLIQGREDELPGSGSRSWAARRLWGPSGPTAA